ncbi:LysR substrate-binding domain-containing protein [Pandoraea terrigena]|nr:LysR substrate-binding domain-containing protein [Pandoraea terrigena]
MYFDITDFRLFVNVADTSSLTRGAERTFLSVPAASNRIKNIEERLQLRLLDRSPQRIVLTEAGRAYLNGARQVLSRLDQLGSELQQFTSGLSGQVRVQANTTAVTEYLPPILSRFLKAFPDVQVGMREKTSAEIVRNIRDGGADIGVISGSVPTDGIESVPFVSSQLMLITPPEHPLLQRQYVYFKDTLEFPFVSLMDGAASNEFYARAAAAIQKTMIIRVQVAGTDAIIRMVEAGAGIALVPKASLTRLASLAAIGARSLSDAWSIREFRVCARRFDELSPIARTFATLLLDGYRQQPNGAPLDY